jgi:hypothetical protein
MLIGDPKIMGGLFIPYFYAHFSCDMPPSLRGGIWDEDSELCLVRIPLSSSPLQSKEQPQGRLGKSASRVTKETSTPESKVAETRVYFWRVSEFHLHVPMAPEMSRMWNIAAAVVICYDCSRPDTLHNALYRVSVSFSALTTSYGN